ncbi:MAG: serine/threonine-protein kinase [Planctomycetota bacterium]|nr:serine/threonine-protein kinase [Planctomycetota bacterium]
MTNTPGNDDPDIDAIIPALVALFQESRDPDQEIILALMERHNADTEGPVIRLEHIAPILRRLQHLNSDSIFPDWIPDRYAHLGEIGSGATSRVYLALDREQQIQVAIKIINPGESLPRFERESKLLQQLKSPHIVRQLGFFKGHSQLHTKAAIVMEYIDGTYLSDLITENQGSPHRLGPAAIWMQQVCSAMIAASDQGIVHRDIKPANLIVATEDHSMKLLDFGIATTIAGQTEGTTAIRLTRSGEVLGTPHYMSPEQSFDSALADIRNDIYSFGATFYHLLTGSTPFTGKDWIDVVGKLRYQVLEAPDARNPDLPKPLATIIERCMAKRARDRFESFHDIHTLLEPVCARYGVREDHRHLQPPEPNAQVSFFSMAPQSRPDRESDNFDSASYEPPSAPASAHLDSPTMSAPPRSPAAPFWGIDSDHHFEGGRRLQLIVGDILEDAADCEVLVSSDDSELSMLGGVALRIKQAAGDEYITQTQHLAPVMPGRVVLSGTGQLPQRFIFHAITIAEPIEAGMRRRFRRDKKRTLFAPTPDLIRGILDDCFHHAQSLGLTTMAFPLLGTGNAGMDPDICLRTMVDYICREMNQGLTPLKSIKMVILPY